MKELFTTNVGRFKLVADLEGLSFLVLLLIAMPLKYMWGKPWLVQNIGMVHGLLFILYLLAILQNKAELGWDWKKSALAAFLSVIPFGTFYVTRKMIPAAIVEMNNKAGA